MKRILGSATVLALSTAVISGTANFVNKFAVSGFGDPVLFTTLKNGLVAVFLIGVFVIISRFGEIKTLNRHQWTRLVLIGVIGGALPFALFFTGLSQTSAVAGSLIHKTLFLWVAVLAIPLLKEKIALWQWIGIALIFMGNLFVGGFTGFRFNGGELMILIATILWAIESVIAKKALADISSLTVASARMMIGSALLFVYILFWGNGSAPITSLSISQWSWLLLTAALLSGYVITWYSALAKAPATYIATLLVPATLVTNILSAVFITHILTGFDILSATFYATGLTLFVYFARKSSFHSLTLVPNH